MKYNEIELNGKSGSKQSSKGNNVSKVYSQELTPWVWHGKETLQIRKVHWSLTLYHDYSSLSESEYNKYELPIL